MSWTPLMDAFTKAGAEAAEALFAIEIQWPDDTPPSWYEDGWTVAIESIREATSEALVELGATARPGIVRVFQDAALAAFHDRFDALNEAFMNGRIGRA